MAVDNFNRADGDPGSNWTSLNGMGKPPIVSNLLQPTNGFGNHGMSWSAATIAADQFSVIDGTLGTGASSAVGPVVRRNGAAYYVAFWNANNGGQYELFEAPSFTRIGSQITNVGVSGTRVLRLEVSGTTVEFFADGVSQISGTNSGIASGEPGIYINSNTSASTADNWEGAILAAAAAAPPPFSRRAPIAHLLRR